MNNKPRIAFCFSGQARTLDQTYLFFQKNLFEAAKEQGFDYDIFCAVEDDEDVEKVNLLNPTKVEKIKSSDVEKIIEQKYGKNFEKEFLKSHSILIASKENNSRFLNAMQQFYKVSKSIKLIDKQNYVLVVRLRFDCPLFNKLNFDTIVKGLGNGIICNKFKIGKKYLKFREINDFFFFGSYQSMITLGDLFENFMKAFEGQKRNNFQNFVHTILNGYKNLAYYINNKTLGKWILPVMPIWLIESYFYRLYTPELIYYYYYKNNGIKINITNMSFILVKKVTNESKIRLENKTIFEL